ncbi:MAG: hypothetical protein FJ100_01775 [Deltaproteobacteria bacterium]|nr:hypothetical protein [Deltaproteobacteria bacterium]
MATRASKATAVVLAAWMGVLGCNDDAAPQLGDLAALSAATVSVRYQFRTDQYGFYASANGGSWQPLWPYGLNFATALPGRSPGEYDADRAQIRRWLETAGEMGVNTLRVKTIQSPEFYQELRRWNLHHPKRPLFLLQGAWLKDPADDAQAALAKDYLHPNLVAAIKDEIDKAVDVVHGRRTILPGSKDNPGNWGRAFGTYTADVSPWTLGWLIGRELDPLILHETALSHPPKGHPGGQFVALPAGRAIEGFIVELMDLVVATEKARYGQQRPVGWLNWPTTDPIKHYTEQPFPASAEEYETLDLNAVEYRGSFSAGVFMAYQSFPYYPDFVMHQPEYAATSDADGPNPWLGYLKALRAAHGKFAVLVAETGHPSSPGCAHFSPSGLNHGGYNELEQGWASLRALRTVAQAGLHGAMIGDVVDQWYRESWLTGPVVLPAHRQRLWYNPQNPNQHFGVVALLPEAATRAHRIDGQQDDWSGKAPQLVKTFPLLSPRGDGFDAMRTLKDVTVDHDAGYLHLRLRVESLDPDGDGQVQWDRVDYVIGLDTVDPLRGDSRFDPVGVLQTERRIEFQVRIHSDSDVQLWVDQPYDLFGIGQGTQQIWQAYRTVANDKGQWLLAQTRTNGDYAWHEKLPDGKAAFHLLATSLGQQTGRLRTGSQAQNSASHFWYDRKTGVMELRIPWALLQFSDPSALRAIDHANQSTATVDTSTVQGIGIVAASLGGTGEAEIDPSDTLPLAQPAVAADGKGKAWRIPAQGVLHYTWDKWDQPPAWHDRRKLSFFVLRAQAAKVLPAAAAYQAP